MQNNNSLDTVAASGNGSQLPPQLSGEHPVINMPFNAIIDGRLYEGESISLIGATARGLVSPQLEGENRLVTFMFPFSGFNVALPIDATIDAASSSGAMSLRFANPSGEHLPQLRHLLNSYISGDIADLKSVLSTPPVLSAAGKSSIKPRRSAGRIFRSLLKGLLITAASVALFGFVGVKAYERFAVLHPQGIALLGTEELALRAVNSGQVEFVNLAAAEGEIAYSVRAASGDSISVAMPCTCEPLPGALVTGATVLAGDTVMTVAPADAAIRLPVRLDMASYRALQDGTKADVTLPSGEVITATLDTQSVRSASDDPNVLLADLVPTTAVDRSMIGQPVDISIHRKALSDVFTTVRAMTNREE